MKVLVIGSGGREHAMVWKLAQSSKIKKLYCAPGNDGIGRMAELVSIAVDDLDGLLDWVKKEEIDLTIVGPEVPLVLGIVDRFNKAGLKIFGPTQKAAMIEGSKAFAKDLMQKYGIPTADYQVFTDTENARAYIEEIGAPIVIKADGLAAGKGVVVALDLQAALQAIDEIMESQKYGESGNKIVVEEYLDGVEVSLLALTDGKAILPMTPAHDHKAVYDGDKGPNTGGMGAFSPSHLVGDQMIKEITARIVNPTLAALANEGIKYRGILYAGLMLTENGPKVLEYNARFGDPETQVILPRLKNDLVELIEAVLEERLEDIELSWRDEKALTIVLTSGGYPGSYEKGKEIIGLDRNGQVTDKDITVFHAGTRCTEEKWLTDGGRVLALTALGADFKQAQERAYQAIEKIEFADQHYRKDIGDKAITDLN